MAFSLFKKSDLDKVVKEVYDSESSEINKDLFNKTYKEISKAVDEGFGEIRYGEPNYDFQNQLKHNGAVFSAFKNHQQAKEMVGALTDELGNKRSFADYRKAVAPITNQYNDSWLKSEYNLAVSSARAASKWKEYEADADLYPNLRYVESVSSDQRDDHRKLYDIVKPINDPFWSSNLPPNGWGCKCSVEQTDDQASEQTPSIQRIPGIAGNPGKSGQIFAASHPYSKNTTKTEKQSVEQQLEFLERKAIRVQVKSWAKNNIQGKTFSTSNPNIKVLITSKGIKETINQPHRDFNQKNIVLRSIDRVLKESVYVGSFPNTKREGVVKSFHYFSFKLNKRDSYAVVKELTNGNYEFYSIVDNIKSN